MIAYKKRCKLKSLRFCAAFLTRLCSSSVWYFPIFFFMKIFQRVFFATGKHISKVFLNSRHFCEFLLVFISKLILQLPDLLSVSFSFYFRFRLSFCLLDITIHDLWSNALFSGKISASVSWFCRALHLLYKTFGKPSKRRNSFELSAIVWNELFWRSKHEKKVLVLNTNFQWQVLLFLPSEFKKMINIFCRYNILILQLILYFLEWHKLDWIDITEMTNT